MRTSGGILTVIVFVFLFTTASSAIASDAAIYGEYHSGMPITDIRGQAGVVEVTGVDNVRLMREGVSFAGAAWTQLFAFDGDLLTDVILHSGYDSGQCEDAYVALVAGGYLPFVIKDGGVVVNLGRLWTPGGEAVADAASAFEPGKASSAELILLDVGSFTEVARGIRNGEGWTAVAGHLPKSAKGAFFAINKGRGDVTISFFAPADRLSTYGDERLMTAWRR